MMTLDAVTKLLAPVRNRVANMVARAIVRLVADGGGIQVLQLGVLQGEAREGVEHFQPYGFTSVPAKGAEAVVLFVGGNRDHGLAVVVDDRRYRKRGLQEGESAIYSKAGQFILLKADGTIEAGAGGAVNLVALSNLVDSRIAAIRTAYNSHTHTSAAPGVATSVPITPLGEQASVAATKVKAE